MKRDELGDLVYFLAVFQERSFTRAAVRLATSQSSLSHTVRRLEKRMGVRLLTRTTRNVVPTEAGEELVATLLPAISDIQEKINALSALGQKTAGHIRVTTSRRAAELILMPAAKQLMREFPEIEIELVIDARFTDVVRDRFDAGVRLGEHVEKDMIAVRIGPDIRMMVVGSPDYFALNPMPQTPSDLTTHNCINLSMATHGNFYIWEFEKSTQKMNVRVNGQFSCSDPALIIDAALNGFGLACLAEDQLGTLVDDGLLIRVLEDWCPPFSGYHLYYPSRHQASPAFNLFVKALRYHK